MDYIEKEISIGDIKNLMIDYDIEVESPDGWVPVTHFVDKGVKEEYLVKTTSDVLSCSGKHLLETIDGWKLTEDINSGDQVLTKNGFEEVYVEKTGNKIKVVDITVDHDNHRYYTSTFSSHNTGAGKSLVMCHQAAANIMNGKKVLYITLEMAEEKISERIDANLLDVTIDDLHDMDKDTYVRRIQRLMNRTKGGLVVKEYPTGTANAAHFKHLLNELKLKKKFIPDIIYLDYLNLCSSSRIKNGSNVNSYAMIKSIAEEVRGLAMEFGIPVVSATQANRSGYGNSDIDITNTSECIYVEEEVELVDGSKVKMKDIKVGMKLKSNDNSKIVTMVHHPKTKKCYKIKTKSGKEIIVSADHKFPSKSVDGDVSRKSLNSGLDIGFKLNTK